MNPVEEENPNAWDHQQSDWQYDWQEQIEQNHEDADEQDENMSIQFDG